MIDARNMMANAKFYEAYSRYLDKEQRYETWEEAVERVMNMHRQFYKDKMTPELEALIQEAEDAYKNKLFLGAQRALQFGGKQLLSHHARLYNCTASYCDRASFFGEAFYLMLCGCGVGFSVQTQHINKLPKISKRTGQAKTFVVPDTIEGWAKALDVLLSSFFSTDQVFEEYANRKVYYDLSNIRPKGAFISGGFKAPGPEGLRVALDKIELLIKNRIDEGYTNLRPIDAYDILMFVADAVISGGVRRSATICLFSKDDKEMINAKTGDWYVTHPARGRSNNSAVLLREGTSKEEFTKIMESVKHSGEPGFIFTDNLEALFNPSLRKGTKILTDKGIKSIETLENQTIQVRDLEGNYQKAKCRLSGKNKPLFKLRLGDKYDYYATKEHKWPVIYKDGLVKKETTELLPGDKIPVNHITSLAKDNKGKGSYTDGFCIGWLYGDGWVTDLKAKGKRQYGFIVSEEDDKSGIGDLLVAHLNNVIKPINKKATISKNLRVKEGHKPWFEFTSSCKKIDNYFKSFFVDKKEYGLPKSLLDFSFSEDYRKGFIDGLFSADGSVDEKQGVISLSSAKEKLVDDLIEFLGFYGFRMNRAKWVQKVNDKTFPNGKTYNCKEYTSFRLTINRKDNIFYFRKTFKFTHKTKQEKLANIVLPRFFYPKQSFITVTSVEDSGLKEDVWDISVYADNHCFQLSHCITGNCVEIGMQGYDEEGNSGFQFCNLTEIAGGKSVTREIFLHQCKVAAILGTLQAGYTDFKYVSDVTKRIVDREALIGVGITGWMNNPDVLFNKQNLLDGTEVVKKWNKKVAKLIGINQAARVTCVKPSILAA